MEPNKIFAAFEPSSLSSLRVGEPAHDQCEAMIPAPRKPTDGPDMTLIVRGRRPVPIFPVEALGKWADDIAALADSKSTRVDYSAVALLSCAAALIGNARRVSPWAGWEEPSALWIAAIGDPSSGKTPAQAPMISLLRQLEAEDADEFGSVQQIWESATEVAAQKRDIWEASVRKAVKNGTEAPALPDDARAPKAPARPRLIASDTTPEAMGTLLARQPKGMLAFRDELSGLLAFDRYSGAEGAERSFYLEAFNGNSFTIDRVKYADPLVIPHLLISILGGIQPDKLSSLLLSGADDGLSARFLYSWPDQLPPRRPKSSADLTRMLAAFRQLKSLKMASNGTGENCVPRVLNLTDEAADWFDHWRTRHHESIQDAPPRIKGHFAKYFGLVLRIALVLEHLWWSLKSHMPAPDEVSAPAVIAAACLIDDYFRPMAECAYGDAAVPEVERNALTLARWIAKAKPMSINARELRRNVRLPGLRDAKVVKAALQELEEAGWLISSPTRQGDTPGRQRQDYRVDGRVYSAAN